MLGETPNSSQVQQKPFSLTLTQNLPLSSNKNNNFDILRIYLSDRNFILEGSDIIKKFAKTVIIVTVLSCFERTLGFVYRVFLSRSIGSEGLGLYQIALSVIGLLITISASGIPITVSRLMIKERTANHLGGDNKAVSAGIIAALAVSIPLCLFFFLFKGSLDFIFADERCSVLFLIILPGVVLTSVYAVIRGFFWGNKSFYIYSAIELAEEIMMIVCGIFLISRGQTVFQKAVYASVAVLLSYVFSFIISSASFVAKGGRIINPKEEMRPLISSSMPITFMRTANSLTSSLIAIILPAVLITTGIDKQQAISEFGIISGMALPLLFIPSTLIGSFSLVLSPELSESFYKKNTEKIRSGVEKSLLYSLLISILIVPAFTGTGEYVGEFVYNNHLAGIYVRNSAFIMIPMSITIISTSLLNSMGFERKTLKYFLIGAAMLLACILILPRFIGSYALIVGYLINYCVTAVMNVLLLKKVCCNKLDFEKKSLIALPLCGIACLLNYLSFNLLKNFMHNFLATGVSCVITFICLILTLLIFKIFTLKELKIGL